MSEWDRPAPRTVAYVDESVDGSYVLAAVIVDAAAQSDVRASLRGALLPRQRRLHRHAESPARRDGLAAMVEDLRCPAVAVIGAPVDRRRQDRARRKCLETLLWELGGHRVDQVRVESRGPVRDRADIAVLAGFRAGGVLASTVRFEHGRPEQDEGLWLPDIVAGAVLAGVRGDDRYRKVLTVVREVPVELR